ncbi:MAG: histidine kinase, partial [candidate division Zixibacteria bacterium]|nr:histidine kinase [candidate division Zixibacteria bacterium]
DKVFIWQGNFQILLAIIKSVEDRANVERDTRLAGVQSVILIEDNVKFYSSYLPSIYTELMLHLQGVIQEGINASHKMLRMRARPKILLCHSFEEAWMYFEQYHETILGVISDINFPRGGQRDPEAGITFARRVKESHPDIPVLLQSNDLEMKHAALATGAMFLMKNSPRLLAELQRFLRQQLSFGDFVFRLPDGQEVARAHDLRELEERLVTIPDESLLFHAERNHFSNWLKARTEFLLAHKLRPQRVSDYESVADLRLALITSLRDHHDSQHRGAIVDFDPLLYDGSDTFTRIGGGSLGGKGRGLVFIEGLLDATLKGKFKDIQISVPPAVILQTDIFDQFMAWGNLEEMALESADDEHLVSRFIEAPMPTNTVEKLRCMLERIRYPLAVRSSSILEDSLYRPFAGIYETIMVPNNHRDTEVRLEELLTAVKRVYASTFSQRAKAYMRATPYRLEEEKMAVVIQQMVGQAHGSAFYPDFSGVGRSYNFYPLEPMSSDDGIAAVALGLGAMVVEGGYAVRFCPKYPRHVTGATSVEAALTESQREFLAVELPDPEGQVDPHRTIDTVRLGLDVAERDGILGPMASVCSTENNAVYDGLSRVGPRIVTFGPVLKGGVFPLPELVAGILDICHRGMSNPVEIEFSGNMTVPPGKPRQFHVVQLRPMVLSHEREELSTEDFSQEQLICSSARVLGNGIVRDIRDILLVDRDAFDRSRTVEVAREIKLCDLELTGQHRPYLLIGIGRWGSADPWLGVPVQWDEITGAKVIVETGFDDMQVAPSQGTHFFQNLNAFEIGYFTVDSRGAGDFLDWEWLLQRQPHSRRIFTRQLRFESPILVKMSGYSGRGVIVKPSN